MNSKLLKRTFGGSILVLSLLFGIAILSSSTAQAQYPGGQDRQDRGDRNRDRDDRWNRDRDRQDQRDRDRERDNRHRRNDRYGRNGGYGNYGYNVYQIAENQGYQDGLNTGANDARQGQSFNPQRSHYYKNATYGYNSSYGRKDEYKQAYRDGFVRGYDEGFRRYGGGYNRNGGYNRRRNNGQWFPFPW